MFLSPFDKALEMFDGSFKDIWREWGGHQEKLFSLWKEATQPEKLANVQFASQVTPDRNGGNLLRRY